MAVPSTGKAEKKSQVTEPEPPPTHLSTPVCFVSYSATHLIFNHSLPILTKGMIPLCSISNIALFFTFLVKSLPVTWKLTHLSRSQILRGEVCPQQAVPVTNELFKRNKQKPLTNPHVLKKVHEQDRENRLQDRLWILVQDDFSTSPHISQGTGSSKGRAAAGPSVAELPRCSRSQWQRTGRTYRCICKHKEKTETGTAINNIFKWVCTVLSMFHTQSVL